MINYIASTVNIKTNTNIKFKVGDKVKTTSNYNEFNKSLSFTIQNIEKKGFLKDFIKIKNASLNCSRFISPYYLEHE